MRERTIRQTILTVLEESEPYALPEPSLREQLDARIRPASGVAEFEGAILFLQTRRYIANLPDDIDETLAKWLITEAGKSILRK